MSYEIKHKTFEHLPGHGVIAFAAGRTRRCLRTLFWIAVIVTIPANETSADQDVSPKPEVTPVAPEALETAGGPYAGTRAGQARDDNGLKLKLVWCPPGSFVMGSPPKEKDRSTDEAQVAVSLTRGFWMGKYEVTQGEFRQVMQTEPWKGQSNIREGERFPASSVDGWEASEFCKKFTLREHQSGRLPAGWNYTLPTESQWEYGCRAGSPTRFCFGEDDSKLGEFAWFDKTAKSVGETYAHEVGKKQENSWGLCDMHGNVWEWCRDGYVSKLPGGTDPFVWQGSGRVIRGGAWYDSPSDCRSGYRGNDSPSNRHYFIGFRVALVSSGP